jgi:AraC-like DNA-binding protein
MTELQQFREVAVAGFDAAVLGTAVTGTRLEHVALGGQGFRGSLVHGHARDIIFDMGCYRAPLLARGTMPDDAPTLALIVRSDGSARMNGRLIQRGACFYFTEGRELTYATAPMTEWVAVRVSRERLSVLGLQLPAAPDQLGTLPERSVASLAASAAQVARGCAGREELERLLRSLALTIGAVESRQVPSRERRLAAVRRALDYIDAYYGEPLAVGDLCAVAGLSWRSLERAFEQVCGLTPKAAITLCRLTRAREALRAAAPGSETVTSVATRCGIAHLGRFPAAYRSVFGEYPSETLARA